jgi:hypothetical protein
MKYICNYSILRFLPYPETGEFVNIGVVLFANNGEFHYKVESTRQRVTRFFKTLDHRVYIRARDEVTEEFTRLKHFFGSHKGETPLLASTFKHLIHPRETMMRFSNPGTVTTENIPSVMTQLFDHYVNHSFANKEYQERFLERQLGSLLSVSNLKDRYKEFRLGTKDYDVRFPFVALEDNQATQAIKPLFFGQSEPARILDHGDAWASKIKRLSKARRLAADTLFIVEPPAKGEAKLQKAFNEAVEALNDFAGVRVVSNQRPNAEIIAEIRRGLPDTIH